MSLQRQTAQGGHIVEYSVQEQTPNHVLVYFKTDDGGVGAFEMNEQHFVFPQDDQQQGQGMQRQQGMQQQQQQGQGMQQQQRQLPPVQQNNLGGQQQQQQGMNMSRQQAGAAHARAQEDARTDHHAQQEQSRKSGYKDQHDEHQPRTQKDANVRTQSPKDRKAERTPGQPHDANVRTRRDDDIRQANLHGQQNESLRAQPPASQDSKAFMSTGQHHNQGLASRAQEDARNDFGGKQDAGTKSREGSRQDATRDLLGGKQPVTDLRQRMRSPEAGRGHLQGEGDTKADPYSGDRTSARLHNQEEAHRRNPLHDESRRGGSHGPEGRDDAGEHDVRRPGDMNKKEVGDMNKKEVGGTKALGAATLGRASDTAPLSSPAATGAGGIGGGIAGGMLLRAQEDARSTHPKQAMGQHDPKPPQWDAQDEAANRSTERGVNAAAHRPSQPSKVQLFGDQQPRKTTRAHEDARTEAVARDRQEDGDQAQTQARGRSRSPDLQKGKQQKQRDQDAGQDEQQGQQKQQKQQDQQQKKGAHNIRDEDQGHKIHQWASISERPVAAELPQYWEKVKKQGVTPEAAAQEVKKGLLNFPHLGHNVRAFANYCIDFVFGTEQAQQGDQQQGDQKQQQQGDQKQQQGDQKQQQDADAQQDEKQSKQHQQSLDKQHRRY